MAKTLWQRDGQLVLTVCGARELLDLELMAFFAPRQCRSAAICVAMDWALQLVRAKRAVVSGSHFQLEQSVANVFLAGSSPRLGGAGPPCAGC